MTTLGWQSLTLCRSTTPKRVLAVAHVPIIAMAISACGIDPENAAGNATQAESVTQALDLVARFSFSGAAGTEARFAANVADPALAAIPVMTRGSGITPSPALDAFSASGWTTRSALDPND